MVMEKKTGKLAVWDIPTRLFHWLLATAFLVAWLTRGDSQYLDVHAYAGYLMLGLVTFRIFWGFKGGIYARFRNFAYSWHAVTHYLKRLITRRPEHFPGHNPAGGWAVFALLTLSLAVGISGLLVLGGEERHGPLAGWLSFEQGDFFHEVHDILATAMLLLVFVHIAGVIVTSFLHKENLIGPMLHGYKKGFRQWPASAMYALTGIMLALTAAITATVYFQGYLSETVDKPYLPYTAAPLPNNTAWDAACSECHLAYHPSLLPARSWQKLLAQQDQHFGDDLGLDSTTIAELSQFANRYAAESQISETAWKIAKTTPATQSPLRISETLYWKAQHQELPNDLWKNKKIKSKANCEVCHVDAKQGTFQDGAMRVPSLRDEDVVPSSALRTSLNNH